MVYVTGDVHGDVSRFKSGKLRWLGKKDTLIVLGDFGFLWTGDKQEKKLLHWLGKRRYKILFLDGCHENFKLLFSYPESEWNGGRVRQIEGNLYYACRGSVFTLEDKKILCFGGGETGEDEEKEPGVNWWPEELPTEAEMDFCRSNLEACGHEVDYILTHDGAPRLLDFTKLKGDTTGWFHRYLDEIQLNNRYKKWYFGRYHQDTTISTKARCVFCDIIKLD